MYICRYIYEIFKIKIPFNSSSLKKKKYLDICKTVQDLENNNLPIRKYIILKIL